ncbi:hypothetical protein GQX73_g7290 [Xylaria multiplex]|uniref:Uncharacterized protein n=1 Tax=Xylaria multiplex TaxID=323545 RepID=A0A7C8IL79_9PEZI|nr:hypothetical protein GQX73_g7290 [Xylaria multiplex]
MSALNVEIKPLPSGAHTEARKVETWLLSKDADFQVVEDVDICKNTKGLATMASNLLELFANEIQRKIDDALRVRPTWFLCVEAFFAEELEDVVDPERSGTVACSKLLLMMQAVLRRGVQSLYFNNSKSPIAIILGGAFDDAGIEVMKEASEGTRSIPWLRPDLTKPTPPLGPEYGKAMVVRIKALLAQLEKEGKMDEEKVHWY